MNVQDIIKKRRLELDLTLKDVARFLGVSEGTVSRYETGDIQNMGIDKIAKLAKVLHCSPGYLMGWEDDPSGTYSNFALSDLEKDIIRKFRTLSNGERSMFLRSIGIDEEKGNVTEHASPVLNAAHDRTDVSSTDADRQHDEDIMDDTNF